MQRSEGLEGEGIAEQVAQRCMRLGRAIVPAAEKLIYRRWRVTVVHFEVFVVQMVEVVASRHLRASP